jgi:hypothetical protein
MKVSIYINSKETSREIPINWDQVTFRQFLALEKCGDDIIQVIAMFTGVDYEALKKAKIKNLDEIIAALGFLKRKIEPVIPRNILTYPVPKNLEFEQVQMYIDLKNYVKESKELTPIEQLERYTLYCAVYACMAKHGKYDWTLAEAMKDEFLEAPCTEVMGIGNFTLLRLIGLNLNINLNSQKPNTLIKKLRLVLKIYRLRLAQRLRSLTWRKRLA